MGMISGTKPLRYAHGHLTQPCCSFYPLACSDDRALLPRRATDVAPTAWAGLLEPSAGLRFHPAYGLLYGAVLLGRVKGCQMHPVRRHDPLCYPQARAALTAAPEALLACAERAWRWAVSQP
jgi:hypothetical protein